MEAQCINFVSCKVSENGMPLYKVVTYINISSQHQSCVAVPLTVHSWGLQTTESAAGTAGLGRTGGLVTVPGVGVGALG